MHSLRLVLVLLLAMGWVASSVKHRQLLRAFCARDCFCSGVHSGTTACGAPCPRCPDDTWYTVLLGSEPKTNTDIKGFDLDGGAGGCSKSASSGTKLPFCKICGSLEAVVKACIDVDEVYQQWPYSPYYCDAITYDTATKCGYLKGDDPNQPERSGKSMESYRTIPKKGWTTIPVVRTSMNTTRDYDIKGSDLACNGQPFCKVCGRIEDVGSACLKRSDCQAFTYHDAEKCGYLKASKRPAVFRLGWTIWEQPKY